MSVGQSNSRESAAATRSFLLRAPVRAYAALGAGQPLQPWTYEPTPLCSDEVEVQVTHCGVCHGDVHLIDNDLGISTYPLVPGHEVIGTITAIGERAESLAIGHESVWVGSVARATDANGAYVACKTFVRTPDRPPSLATEALLIVCESIIDLPCPSRTNWTPPLLCSVLASQSMRP